MFTEMGQIVMMDWRIDFRLSEKSCYDMKWTVQVPCIYQTAADCNDHTCYIYTISFFYLAPENGFKSYVFTTNTQLNSWRLEKSLLFISVVFSLKAWSHQKVIQQNELVRFYKIFCSRSLRTEFTHRARLWTAVQLAGDLNANSLAGLG